MGNPFAKGALLAFVLALIGAVLITLFGIKLIAIAVVFFVAAGASLMLGGFWFMKD